MDSTNQNLGQLFPKKQVDEMHKENLLSLLTEDLCLALLLLIRGGKTKISTENDARW